MTLNEARLSICKQCQHFNHIIKTCKLCNCFMPAKTLIKSASCPDQPPRWIAVNDPASNPNCGSCPH